MAGSTSATDRALVELIRMGKVDAEIAVRLGLSAGVIEDRVTSICNDAGFTSRAELAASRGDLRPAVVLQADPPEQRRFPLTAVLSLVTTLAICAVAAWMFVPRPAGESSATYAPATANLTTPSFVPLPADTSVINGVHIQDAVIGVPEYLPAGITLLILRTDAASGNTTIERVAQASEGLVNSILLAPATGDITQAVVSADGANIAAAVCIDCTTGRDGAMSILRSSDSGSNWAQVTSIAGPAFPGLVAVTRDDVVLDWGDGQARMFRMADGGRVCAAGGTTLVSTWWGASGLATRDPVSGHFVDCRGRTMFDPGLEPDAAIDSVRPFSRPGKLIAISWREGAASDTEFFVGAFSAFEYGALRVPNPAYVTAWRGASGFGTIFDAQGEPTPVRFDFSAGMYFPLLLHPVDHVEVLGALP